MQAVDEPRVNDFGHQVVESATPIIELKSTNGFSVLRDLGFVDGSEVDLPNAGRLEFTGSEYKLITGADGTHTTRLESAEFGRYVPGNLSEAGIGVRSASSIVSSTGGQILKWGVGTTEDRFGFGVDGVSPFVFRRRAGSEKTKVRLTNWNVNPAKSGASAYNLDLTEGNIFHVTYPWYGYGTVEWSIILQSTREAGARALKVPVHREEINAGNTSVANPNLPIFAEIDNSGEATAEELFVGGRQYKTLGDYNPNRRISSHFVTDPTGGTLGTSFQPIVSFRRKANENNGSFWEFTSVKPAPYKIFASDDIIWQLVLDADLTAGTTNPSWGALNGASSSETPLEADSAASDFSGGEVVDSGLVEGGNKIGTGEVVPIDLDYIRRKPMTLVARTVSASNASLSAVVGRARVEW